MDTDSDEDGRDEYDAPHDLGTVDDPNAYWRRRFFILGGGVAVLALCAWLFPVSHQAPARTSAAVKASMAALAKRGVLPSAAYGGAWSSAVPRKTVPKKTAQAGPKPSPAASAKPAAGANGRKAGIGYRPSASPSPGPTVAKSSATASSGVAGGSRCAPADIVLSLFSGMASYGRHALPTFSVYAVSTSASACTLSYGPGSVRVVVTRHGHVVWDSAACKPPAARPTRFTLGVPQVLTITWNRQAREPVGCAGSLPVGAWGTFDAVAMSVGQTSPVRSFKISR